METDYTERAYLDGQRQVWLSLFHQAARHLGYYDQIASHDSNVIMEIEHTRVVLRRLCADYGDNDWPDDLHLVDILEKHLEPYLAQRGT